MFEKEKQAVKDAGTITRQAKGACEVSLANFTSASEYLYRCKQNKLDDVNNENVRYNDQLISKAQEMLVHTKGVYKTYCEKYSAAHFEYTEAVNTLKFRRERLSLLIVIGSTVLCTVIALKLASFAEFALHYLPFVNR